MDFAFTSEQDEAAELAARILKDRATNERMKEVEAGGDRFDADLWTELGSAGLLGLALPEDHSGKLKLITYFSCSIKIRLLFCLHSLKVNEIHLTNLTPSSW